MQIEVEKSFESHSRAVENCLRELVQGHGGLNAYISFARQVTLEIPGLSELNCTVYVNYIDWQSAIANADKEVAMKKTVKELRETAAALAGLECPQCHSSYPSTFEKCTVCGCELEADFREAEKLTEEGYPVGPRTFMILKGFHWLLQAYRSAYRGLSLILKETAKTYYGAEHYTVGTGTFWEYLKLSRRFIIKGEQRTSLEQRQLLQLLAWGCLAGAPPEQVDRAFQMGVEVVKYGYLAENVRPEYRFKLRQAEIMFLAVYEPLIRRFEAQVEQHTEHTQKSLAYNIEDADEYKRYWGPALLLPLKCWIRGQLTGDLTLTSFPELGKYIKVRQESGSVNIIFSPLGRGKTLFLRTIGQDTVESGGIVLTPVGDDDNQCTLTAIPLIPFSRTTRKLAKYLEMFKMKPYGLPTLNLNLIRADDLNLLEEEPITKFDRIVYVPETVEQLNINFNIIIRELGKVAREMGWSKTCGYINIRNLGRFENRTNIELALATALIDQFTKWRVAHKDFECRVQLDELAELGGAAQIRRGGSSEYMMGGQIISFLRQSRRKRLNADGSSQRIAEIMHEIREHSTNIFFRDLAEEQMKVLGENLQLEQPSMFEVVKAMNVEGALSGTYLWWWYSRPLRTLNLIQPCPPTHMAFDMQYSLREHFQACEDYTGVKILLEDPSECPVLPCSETVEKEEEQSSEAF